MCYDFVMDYSNFDPNDSLATLLNKTTRALSTRLQALFTASGLDVTSEQWMILLLLWQEDGQSPYQLAEIIGKDRAAITRLIDGLERRGLAVRMNDKTDGRQKRVYLSSQGRAMEKKLVPLGLSNIKHAQSGISSKDLVKCKEVLRKVFKNLTL